MFKTLHNLHYEQIGKEVRCIEDELPFEIPENWCWTKISNFCSILVGKRIPAGKKLTSENTGHIYIRVSDMKNGTVKKDNLKFVPNDIYPTIKKYIINKEDVFITVAGTIGRVGKIPFELDGANLTENADRLVFSKINQDWLIYVLSSPFIQSQIAASTTKVGQPKLAITRIEQILIPLPSIYEQKRIVNKIKELEPLIDKYRDAEEKLYELNSNIKEQLKKSILQYAIEGKLIPQDPNDEPASLLLDRIYKEKQKLITEGKIKKDKNESIIYRRDNSYYEKQSKNDVCIDEQIQFSIPDSWCWIRFKEFTSFNIGKTPERDNDQFWFEGEYPWVSVADLVENGLVNSTKEKISKLALDKKFSNKLVKQGTLLMSFKLTVGKTSILDIDAVHNEAIISITPYLDYNNITRNYLFYSMPLLSLNGETKRAIKGNTLNSKSLNALLIPVPPIQEQRRIVDMIVKLNNLIG